MRPRVSTSTCLDRLPIVVASKGFNRLTSIAIGAPPGWPPKNAYIARVPPALQPEGILVVCFPACQVQMRVVRFLREVPQLLKDQHRPVHSGHCRTSRDKARSQCQQQAPDRSGHSQASTASVRSQWALLEFNSKLQMAVCNPGLQQQAPDRSGHSRASTASVRSQWALTDLNSKRPHNRQHTAHSTATNTNTI